MVVLFGLGPAPRFGLSWRGGGPGGLASLSHPLHSMLVPVRDLGIVSRVVMKNQCALVLFALASHAAADCESGILPWLEGSGDMFGNGVAGSGDLVVAGVPDSSLGGFFEHGRVLVSTMDDVLIELPMPPVESGFRVGSDVAVDDGFVFASCTGRTDGFNGNVGGVLVWTQLDEDVWSEPQLLTQPDWDDQFFAGYQIAVSNGILAVSIPGLSGGFPYGNGAVDLWILSDSGSYDYSGRISEQGSELSFFGASIDLNDSYLVVGAPIVL